MQFLVFLLTVVAPTGVVGRRPIVPLRHPPLRIRMAASTAVEPPLLQLLEERRVGEFFRGAAAEPPAVVALLKDTGLAGVIAYLFTAASFYLLAGTIGEVTFHAVSGQWLDPRVVLLPDGAAGKTEALAAIASFYLLCKPFAPVRLGGALLLTPDVKRFIDARPALVAFLDGIGELWAASFGVVFASLSAPLRRAALKDELLELARESRGGVEALD